MKFAIFQNSFKDLLTIFATHIRHQFFSPVAFYALKSVWYHSQEISLKQILSHLKTRKAAKN
jgi:hypothetical protein